MNHLLFTCALLLCIIGVFSTQDTIVFENAQEDYVCYRIPALLQTPQVLLAFAEGRNNPGCSDHGYVDIVVKASVDGGQTWSANILVYSTNDDHTVGNPAPVYDSETGVVHLLFCIDNDQVYSTTSEDFGMTWSEPVEITNDVKKDTWGWYATGPPGGIQLQSGRLLIASDHQNTEEDFGAHSVYSDDHGATWQLGGLVPFVGGNEAQVAELASGVVIMSIRYQASGKKALYRRLSYSLDEGESWSIPSVVIDYKVPVCEGSMISTDTGLLLASNPVGGNRENVTVFKSENNGLTWEPLAQLWNGFSAYSSLSWDAKSQVVSCLFEANGGLHLQTIPIY